LIRDALRSSSSLGESITSSYRNGDCVGPEKVRRVLSACTLSEYEVIYAYGDTSEDALMLDLAHRRFFRWEEIAGGVSAGRKSDHVDLNPSR
jgi:hypothetical protein